MPDMTDHVLLLLIAFLATLGCYTALALTGNPVDEKIIGTIGVGLFGALAGAAQKKHRRGGDD